MAESKKGKWRDKTIERLNRAQAPTVFLGEEATQSGVEASDQPQFDVFQVKLQGKDDAPIIISGNVLNVELQVSLLKALDQLLEIRKIAEGSRESFEIWFEDFAYEFKRDPIKKDFRTGPEASKLDKNNELKFWGVSKDERPKFKWITPAKNETGAKETEDFHKLGYYVIFFWKNRSKEDEFIYLTGTLTEIKQHCIDAMRVSVDSKSSVGFGGFVSNKGKPKVVLFFEEKLGDVEEGYQPIKATLSFRLNNLTEKWDTPNMTN
ncbi:MAG: hypothetical protein ACRCU2_27015, partial [Planktothrix sp.]